MDRLETNNEFYKGIYSGFIASTLMFFFLEILYWVKLIKFGQSFLSGNTVFEYGPGLLLFIISYLISIGIGMFWGVVIAFLFSKVFTENGYILKGIGIGFAIFIFHLGILDEHFHYPRMIHEETGTLIAFGISYFIYGIVTSICLRKLGIFKR